MNAVEKGMNLHDLSSTRTTLVDLAGCAASLADGVGRFRLKQRE
jgi:hypothetical protein